MIDSSAIEYARKGLNDGFSEAEIKKELAKSGWSDGDASEAIERAKSPSKKKEPESKEAGADPLALILTTLKSFTWAGWLGVVMLILGLIVLLWALTAPCEHCIIL